MEKFVVSQVLGGAPISCWYLLHVRQVIRWLATSWNFVPMQWTR